MKAGEVLVVFMIITLLILLAVEVNSWSVCSSYMKSHLQGLEGR